MESPLDFFRILYGKDQSATEYVLPISMKGEYEESFSLDALFTAVLMDKHETFLDRELPVMVMPPVRWLPSQEDALVKAVTECGKNWVKIAKRVGDPRLTAEHCR